MKTIYLLRHAQPEFACGESLCIGRTDLPLSTLGRMQCVLLAHFLRKEGIPVVYHSGMRRTEDTARAICESCLAQRDFREIDVGAWEGMSFRAIRDAYPEIYELRGRDPYRCTIPGGEAPQACLHRARAVLERVTEETKEDRFAIVAHAGINRLLLCALLKKPMEQYLKIPQPYGCVNVLQYEDGVYRVQSVGKTPYPALDEGLIEALYQAVALPERVRRHCRAVAKKALQLAQNHCVDEEKLYTAALLHDLFRQEENHAQLAAQQLGALGYPEIGALIAYHHDLEVQEGQAVDEKMLLYLADKLVYEDREVSLEERFAASGRKAVTEAARAAHARRYAQAKRAEKLVCAGVGCFQTGMGGRVV